MTEVERHETISELVHMLKHPYIDAFTEMYNKVQLANVSNRYILREFQNEIREVSLWTGSKKDEETLKRFACYIKDVEKALSQLARLNKDILKKEMKLITARDFLYSCYLNLAREIWTKPFLFYHRVNKSEYQKNLMAIEKLVSSEIKSTIRRIPVTDVVVSKEQEDVQEKVQDVQEQEQEDVQVQEQEDVQEQEQEDFQEQEQEQEDVKEIIISESNIDESSEAKKAYIKNRNHKFQRNSLEAYNNYLNPLVFKPPKKSVRTHRVS